jgi:hypothetical protein
VVVRLTSTRQRRIVLEVARHREKQFVKSSARADKCRQQTDLKHVKRCPASRRSMLFLCVLCDEMCRLIGKVLSLNRLLESLSNLTQVSM